MSNIAKKAAKETASKASDLVKALRKTTSGWPGRLGRIRLGHPPLGSSGARAAEEMAVDVVEAAGGRVVDAVAVRVDNSEVGQRLDATASRGIERALSFADRHAVGAVVVLAVAATLVEVEFGLGVVAVGTLVLLVTRRGESTRILIATGGRRALGGARRLYDARRGLGAVASA